jgi:hypothetical protein
MPLLARSPVNRDQATIDAIYSVPARLEAARVQLVLTPNQQAVQIGIGIDTLARLAQSGSNPTQSTLVKCLRWLSER